MVSQDLAASVIGAVVVDDALFSPHRPVKLLIKARPRAMTIRSLKTATTIGATLPHGPMGKAVENGTESEGMDRDQLYNLFLERLEGEVASLLGFEARAREALMGRGERAKIRHNKCYR